MKTLFIITTGMNRAEKTELLRREEAGEIPRGTLFETEMNCDVVDEIYMQKVPRWRKLCYRLFPVFFAQVLEAFYNRKKYDAVISWSERRAFLFALLLKLARSRAKHVAMMYWMSKPKQAFFLRFAQSHIHKIITWSSVQAEYAIQHLKIPRQKFKLVGYPVDQKYWTPTMRIADLICSVGSEMRDYSTLIKALDGLDIKCHIAAKQIRIIEGNSTKEVSVETFGVLPENVTIGYKNHSDLRTLYSQSRFVVIPLMPSDTDNGVTSILEAMAMGKTVICSRTKGQVDVIQEGKTGIFVPQGDHLALRDAILNLWNHPEIAEQMGKEARRYIEQHHTLDQFVGSVKSIVEELTGKRFYHVGGHINKNSAT
jgi:glycosyltransferase involved in cell wall biosynthesis